MASAEPIDSVASPQTVSTARLDSLFGKLLLGFHLGGDEATPLHPLGPCLLEGVLLRDLFQHRPATGESHHERFHGSPEEAVDMVPSEHVRRHGNNAWLDSCARQERAKCLGQVQGVCDTQVLAQAVNARPPSCHLHTVAFSKQRGQALSGTQGLISCHCTHSSWGMLCSEATTTEAGDTVLQSEGSMLRAVQGSSVGPAHSKGAQRGRSLRSSSRAGMPRSWPAMPVPESSCHCRASWQ